MVIINLIFFFLAVAAGEITPPPIRGEETPPPPCYDTMKEPEFRDAQTPIRVEPGQGFSIILDSNPTTGYSWRMTEPPDEKFLLLRDKSYRPPDTLRKGAGGEEIWNFTATAAGRTDIVFEYVRPWEKGKKPARTRKFTVIAAE